MTVELGPSELVRGPAVAPSGVPAVVLAVAPAPEPATWLKVGATLEPATVEPEGLGPEGLGPEGLGPEGKAAAEGGLRAARSAARLRRRGTSG